jgi:hypothetical protein
MPMTSVIDYASSTEPLLVQTGSLVASSSLYKDAYSTGSSSTTERDTDAPMRRVVLLPPQPGKAVSGRTTEALDPSSTGLLTRYKLEQMALSHAERD